MVVDAFIFFNELKMLQFRLEEMYEHVDYFVLVESDLTFSGNPKKLYFQENKDLFTKYLDKIIYVKSELPTQIIYETPEEIYDLLKSPKYPTVVQITDKIRECETIDSNFDCWVREYMQRNNIIKGLEIINPKDEDIILISDVDEIIDTNFLVQIKNGNSETGLVNTTNSGYHLWQKWYSYNLECVYAHNNNKMVICNFGKLKEIGDVNSARWTEILPVRGITGWHFSYFGDIDYIKYKIESFAHQEYNKPEFTDEEKIKSKIVNNRDLFNRDTEGPNSWYNYVKFDVDGYWPKNIMLLKKLFNL